MAFGEVAMLDGATRSAVVKAETDLECHLLKRDDFEALERSIPASKSADQEHGARYCALAAKSYSRGHSLRLLKINH